VVTVKAAGSLEVSVGLPDSISYFKENESESLRAIA
jgi:hypothetical protein